MNKYGLYSRIRKSKKIKSVHEAIHTYENKLKRKFCSASKNCKWTTAITQFTGSNRTLYLSALKDLFDGSILGYAYATHSKKPIVSEPIRKAVLNVDSTENYEILLHSDQGSQYTSHGYHQYLEKNGINASMSRHGTPIDNAPIESFFSTIKVGWLPDTSKMTLKQIAKDIDEYIEFYNNERIQLRSGLSSKQYRLIAA